MLLSISETFFHLFWRNGPRWNQESPRSLSFNGRLLTKCLAHRAPDLPKAPTVYYCRDLRIAHRWIARSCTRCQLVKCVSWWVWSKGNNTIVRPSKGKILILGVGLRQCMNEHHHFSPPDLLPTPIAASLSSSLAEMEIAVSTPSFTTLVAKTSTIFTAS